MEQKTEHYENVTKLLVGPERRETHAADAIVSLEEAIKDLAEWRKRLGEGSGEDDLSQGGCGRELALAITNAQQAVMWAMRAGLRQHRGLGELQPRLGHKPQFD